MEPHCPGLTPVEHEPSLVGIPAASSQACEPLRVSWIEVSGVRQ
jgi:hypothetical protein